MYIFRDTETAFVSKNNTEELLMNFIATASTDIGNTKSTNQDSFGVRTMTTTLGKMAFAVLCDGMGGLSKGEVASSAVVRAFYEWVDTKLPILCTNGLSDDVIRNDWTRIVVDSNEKIKAYGAIRGISIGTTVTAILVTARRYYIINVGDTRAYEIADSIRILTKDHTVVAKEIEYGRLTPEDAEKDPRRSVLLQCVGASDTVVPDLFFGDTAGNTVYMLCSDGFRHEISESEIHRYLHPEVMTDESGMKNNIDLLISINKQRQERDNITAVSIRTFD